MPSPSMLDHNGVVIPVSSRVDVVARGELSFDRDRAAQGDGHQSSYSTDAPLSR